MADITSAESTEVIIADGTDDANRATVGASGDLKVAIREVSPDSDKLKMYSCSFDVNLPTGGTQTNMALIRNPSGSGKTMRIIEIGTDITNTVSVAAYYRLYAAPTVTATGTSQTLTSLALGGGASSAMLIYSGPTTSATGARIDTWYSTGGASGIGYVSEYAGMLTLAAGQDLLLTGTPDGTNRNTMLTIWWMEE